MDYDSITFENCSGNVTESELYVAEIWNAPQEKQKGSKLFKAQRLSGRMLPTPGMSSSGEAKKWKLFNFNCRSLGHRPPTLLPIDSIKSTGPHRNDPAMESSPRIRIYLSPRLSRPSYQCSSVL